MWDLLRETSSVLYYHHLDLPASNRKRKTQIHRESGHMSSTKVTGFDS